MNEGIWCPKGCRVTNGGQVVGNAIVTDHRGYRWGRFVMPNFGWSAIAAEFLRSKNRPQDLMNFTNSWLGEAWEPPVQTAGEVILGDAPSGGRLLTQVPEWVLFLTAAIDVQLDHLWYGVYGWGIEEIDVVYDIRFALIDEGKIGVKGARAEDEPYTDPDFTDYEITTTGSDGQVKLSPDLTAAHKLLIGPSALYRKPGGDALSIPYVAIDGRYRQDEVHQFARLEPERIYICLGATTPQVIPYTMKAIDKIAGRKGKAKTGLLQATLKPEFHKGRFARLVRDEKLDIPLDVSAAWNRQIQSQRKILERDARGQKVEKWILKAGAKDDHQFDVAYMNVGVADIAGLFRDPAKLLQDLEGQQVVTDWFARQKAKRKKR